MDSLLPLAKKVGEKLKARKETVGVSESLGRRPDLRRAARRARRLGLLHGRRRGLHAPGRRRLPRGTARKARRRPLLLRAVGAAGRRARPRAAEDDLGPRRDRRVGSDRQFLRRSCRPHLRRRRRPQRQASRAPCAPARTTASPTCAPSPPKRSSCWTSSFPEISGVGRLNAATARSSQPTMKARPPIGATAPNHRGPPNDRE